MSESIDDAVLRKYKILKRLGKGSYGIVWKASDRETNETVAIKKCFDCFQNSTDSQRTFREMCLLQQLSDHPNIVKLYDVSMGLTGKDMYMVFEYMEADLGSVTRAGVLQPVHVQYIVYQLLSALKYMHSASVVHRDIKPANVLLDAECRVKLCDFGLSRILYPNRINTLTGYVATRWYRAPEVLVKASQYSFPVDVWAVGVLTGIMQSFAPSNIFSVGEMIQGSPIFPGTSTPDQLNRILQVTGWPTSGTENIPPEISRRIEIKPLCELVPRASIEALDFMRKILQFEPSRRASATSALSHPFLFGFATGEEPQCSRSISLAIDDNLKLGPDEYRPILRQELSKKKNELELRLDSAMSALHFSS